MNDKMIKTTIKVALMMTALIIAYWLGRTANHDTRFYVLRGEKLIVVEASTGEELGGLSVGGDVEVRVWKVNR